MSELTQIIADGSMRALALHAQRQGVDGGQYLPKLRSIIKAEYPELMDTLGKALDANMGEALYRETINIYCNAWAVKALAG